MTGPRILRTALRRACVCGHDVLDVTDGDTAEQLTLDPELHPDGTVVVYRAGDVVVARRRGEPATGGHREHLCPAMTLDDLLDAHVGADPGIEQSGGWRTP